MKALCLAFLLATSTLASPDITDYWNRLTDAAQDAASNAEVVNSVEHEITHQEQIELNE